MHRIVARSIDPSGAPARRGAGRAGTSRRRLGSLPVAALAALATALPASADDLDVYRARLATQQKPNILFVLDFSGSMNEDIYGDRAADSGLPPKIDILRDAMTRVFDDNVGTINAGLGSVYDGRPSGVRWPIAPLDADPHDVDPDIPAGRYTMSDVMTRQLFRSGAGGDTRTVNALVEAAQYFRGAAVTNGGADPKRPGQHRPDVWTEDADPALSGYGGGNRHAAIRASYVQAPAPSATVPSPGYWENLFEEDNFEYCDDRSASGGTNDCAGKPVIADSCRAKDGGTWTNEEGDSGTYAAKVTCRYEREDDWDPTTYLPPSALSCQANAIVLVSDGEPDEAWNNDSLRDVIGMDASGCEDLSQSVFGAGPGEATQGDCGPEVVAALAGGPQIPGVPDSAVRTYTVGFDVDGPGKTYLQRLAADGEGAFFAAERPEELSAALQSIVDDVAGGAETFVELAVGVDRASFSSDDRAFLSLFSPSARRGWSGNLKGYFLDDRGLVDVDGQRATGPDGEFLETARSFWSAGADGASVELGGASGRLDATARKLYTDSGDPADWGADLSLSPSLAIDPANGDITAADLGLADGSPEREAALAWLRGAPMGDPLHSKSVGVDYGARRVVYVMTNQGLLHAIDATAPSDPGDGTPGSGDGSGGEEIFAYMPRRLLANLPTLAAGESGGDHVYGLDGGITRWHEDTDGDGVVDAGESLLLVLGMRRGGSAYHAIDVSDPESPSLAWVVDDASAGFAKLAQTWSRPALVNVRRGTGEERVLVFGGGYDADRLDGESKRRDADGDAVFVVDRAGKLVRRFDGGGMKHSIAADVTAIDTDSDDLADRLYAADVGGRVWRIDFDDPWAAGGTITELADLHVDGAPQPLFSAPSVALIRGAGEPFLAVSVGSGDRTDPLDPDSRNALFALRDPDVAKGAPSAPGIDADDLYDASADALGSTDPETAAAARAALEAARGWRIDLGRGEKSLSRVVSFEGSLLATTYEPEPDAASDPCSFDETRRFYAVDIGTARAAYLSGVGPAEPGAARARTLSGSGLPGPPVVVYPADSARVDIVVGNEVVESPEKRFSRVYWHAR